MNELVRRLEIVPAQNGFMVYINIDHSQGTIRPVPFVFESLDSMQKFIAEKFEEADPKCLQRH